MAEEKTAEIPTAQLQGRPRFKLGASIDIMYPDMFNTFLCEMDDQFVNATNVIPLGYHTMEQCAKARKAIDLLNEICPRL